MYLSVLMITSLSCSKGCMFSDDSAPQAFDIHVSCLLILPSGQNCAYGDTSLRTAKLVQNRTDKYICPHLPCVISLKPAGTVLADSTDFSVVRYGYARIFLRHLNEFSCSYEHILIKAGFFPDGKISEHETGKSNVSDAGR